MFYLRLCIFVMLLLKYLSIVIFYGASFRCNDLKKLNCFILTKNSNSCFQIFAIELVNFKDNLKKTKFEFQKKLYQII